MKQFQVIVVGSGHAGCEAAYAASRLGLSVLIVTVDWKKTAFMSCNPSIGGLGKGHIVKEIDALGGLMGRAADASCIQFKRLNASKGPAVRGSRVQCDKSIYSAYVREFLSSKKNISYLSAEVKSLLFEGRYCRGVVTHEGKTIRAEAVVLTTGTFMRAMMHIGSFKKEGGRIGEKATHGLSSQLKEMGFRVRRLKTGTPPRLKRSSIDFSVLSPSYGDKNFVPFSFFSSPVLLLPQQACHLTYTNESTHEIIRKNLHFSPLHTGAIQSSGPRYCPSVEDKVIRFADKTRHQSFLEPETLGGDTIYLQGLSTSLPAEIQIQFLQTIPGLKQVEILKPGYAVEYDFFDPQDLFPSLETKAFENLFFAGQINGSSGYEEAAGQGLLAGINAGLKIRGEPPFILKRHCAYIGVLVDDLVTKGTEEPYRMLTSRAEHRLVLREDNTNERLFPFSEKLQLLSEKKLNFLRRKLQQRSRLMNFLEKQNILPNEKTNQRLRSLDLDPLRKPRSFKEFLCRPEVSWSKAEALLEKKGESFPKDCWESVEIKWKYEGYIRRQNQFISQTQVMEDTLLSDLVYENVRGLSLEALEKLKKVRPRTLAQASRISGIPPSAVQALIIYLKSKNVMANYGKRKKIASKES